MEALSGRFPDDAEVAITHALSLVMAASPTDKTYANQLRAGDILEREYARHPQHPGISHYLIHAYDVPALAHKGIAAAERYAALAADAPHALHMPSHIFTRVGRWEDSIETNRRSAETARAREEVFDELHAVDYMVYGYLQTGRPEAARRALDDIGRYAAWTPPTAIGGYALTAMPARLALERGDWEAAAGLGTRRYGVPFVDATTHFARAIGAARAGRPEATVADVEALKAAAACTAGPRRVLAGASRDPACRCRGMGSLRARASAKPAWPCLMRLQTAKPAPEKHPVTPGPLFPAREQLAEMLLAMDRHTEARQEFEAVQQTEPNRFRAVYGAGRAAELAGDRNAARRHYEHLVRLAEHADASRPEIEQARAFVSQR
jgi:tetratricopeptide (TPR) repeat protein